MWESKMDNLFVLGADDPEMNAIEMQLATANVDCVKAMTDGKRCHPGNAYKCDNVDVDTNRPTIWVECGPAAGYPDNATVIDHHRSGDPGYGRPPSDYWEASSLGQVCTILGVKPTSKLRIIAAADHCLAEAYRGQCPDVDPVNLAIWRTDSRAAFQRRPLRELLADIEAAKKKIMAAPELPSGVRDLTGRVIPELPEAACQLGLAVLAGPLDTPDKRRKVVLQAASQEQIGKFLTHPPLGLVDCYGDPARGFAGGYYPKTGDGR